MSNEDFQQSDPSSKPLFPVHERSWTQRNGLWFIPLMIFVVGVPLFCCGSFFLTARWAIDLLEAPRDAAVGALESDTRVTDRIGSPIKTNKKIHISDMNIKNDNGNVEIGFDAIGPNGTADVSGEMIMTGGIWSPRRLVVTFDDGTELIVPKSASKAETDK